MCYQLDRLFIFRNLVGNFQFHLDRTSARRIVSISKKGSGWQIASPQCLSWHSPRDVDHWNNLSETLPATKRRSHLKIFKNMSPNMEAGSWPENHLINKGVSEICVGLYIHPYMYRVFRIDNYHNHYGVPVYIGDINPCNDYEPLQYH